MCLYCLAGYVALFALLFGYPFALTWPRQSKWIKVHILNHARMKLLLSVALHGWLLLCNATTQRHKTECAHMP